MEKNLRYAFFSLLIRDVIYNFRFVCVTFCALLHFASRFVQTVDNYFYCQFFSNLIFTATIIL